MRRALGFRLDSESPLASALLTIGAEAAIRGDAELGLCDEMQQSRRLGPDSRIGLG
jgi:hypothetical protein